MTYIMGQMRGVGIVYSRLFDIEIWMGVLIGGGIVFFYAGLGGMKGITYSGCPVLCDGIFLHHSCHFYIRYHHRKCNSAAWIDRELH